MVPLSEVKLVRFVKSWEDSGAPEERKAFVSRPKLQGLWVRLDFRDGDTLECLIPNQLADWEPSGFLGTPPDSAGNTQRVFIPRAAVVSATVLGVIGSPRRAKPAKSTGSQLRMFD